MSKVGLTFLFILFSFSGFAQDYPAKPNTLVNDYSGTLSEAQVRQLENKLVAFDDSTSIQIAIALVKSVGDYDINEYTLGLGRKWGVGSKKNTGIMIVAALGDRKISIQTGYGLEGALPDVYAKRIIENDIKPYFKAGDYYGGLEAGTTAIIKYTKGEYKSDAPKAARKKEGGGASGVLILIIIVVIVIVILKKGGGNGGSQVIGGRGVADALFWGMLLGGSGRRSGGSGFGGGSGGFGGFGGGSFGGGGSSGSW